jgi:hypothetical protein
MKCGLSAEQAGNLSNSEIGKVGCCLFVKSLNRVIVEENNIPAKAGINLA